MFLLNFLTNMHALHTTYTGYYSSLSYYIYDCIKYFQQTLEDILDAFIYVYLRLFAKRIRF